ncbi:MAG: ABC transporter ATP-binding protein [Candidatus Omnitrophica bacterium]|nr:ABC transporter ATP-binding protein [Candidatus Omnitrophota bacterium]
MNTTIIETKEITKLFWSPLSLSKISRLDLKRTKPVKALDQISFKCDKGSTLVVLGPNGAGKTTLLKIISTLVLADKGEVKIAGYKVGKDDEKIKSKIGLASGEERSFYWRLTGRQNLEFFASLYGMDKNEIKSRLEILFKLFKIDYQEKRFDTYSTGMKRRFSLIRALIHDPEILLLDEPTKSLDYNCRQELTKLIKELTMKGKTVILATHDIQEAENLSSLFMILNKGRLCGFGSKEELSKKIGLGATNLAKVYLTLTENV